MIVNVHTLDHSPSTSSLNSSPSLLSALRLVKLWNQWCHIQAIHFLYDRWSFEFQSRALSPQRALVGAMYRTLVCLVESCINCLMMANSIIAVFPDPVGALMTTFLSVPKSLVPKMLCEKNINAGRVYYWEALFLDTSKRFVGKPRAIHLG